MKKYCAMERDYDEETQHYCDEQQQKIWEAKIVSTINQFDRKSKNKQKSKQENSKSLSR